MKIAICGAHGVGKTTISKMISERFNLNILPDIVVEAFNLGLEINENTPIETQIRLVGKQFLNERINNDFVADKCIFDYYVYAGALGMDSQVVDVVRKIAMKTFNYDYIFYIRPEFPIEDDGIRSTNPDFQKAIQDYYEKFLIDNNIKYTLLTGSVDDRFNTVLKVINN